MMILTIQRTSPAEVGTSEVEAELEVSKTEDIQAGGLEVVAAPENSGVVNRIEPEER